LDYDETYLFDLAYSVNGGKDYIEIIANKDNDGVYTWVVPDKITKIAKIKISDSLDKGIYDLSDAYFSIVAREDLSIQEEKKEEAGVVVQAALKDKASKESKDKKDKVTKESKKKKDKVSKENKKLPGKNLYDLLIKIGDSRSSYSEGDIVILRPSGYIWSVEEREKFLIAQVYLTEKQAEELTSTLKTKDGEILSRRKYRINLLKQGLKGLTGSIKRPKGSFEAGVIEDKAN
jgi:uncharacterized protein YgiM (DUF1202 family)